MAFDIFGLNANQVITSHSASDCEAPCPLHSPSDHPLNTAPLQWRSDRRIFERVCPHGIGHNDPDSTAYNRRHGLPADDSHGCDGCCVGNGHSSWQWEG